MIPTTFNLSDLSPPEEWGLTGSFALPSIVTFPVMGYEHRIGSAFGVTTLSLRMYPAGDRYEGDRYTMKITDPDDKSKWAQLDVFAPRFADAYTDTKRYGKTYSYIGGTRLTTTADDEWAMEQAKGVLEGTVARMMQRAAKACITENVELEKLSIFMQEELEARFHGSIPSFEPAIISQHLLTSGEYVIPKKKEPELLEGQGVW